MAISYGTYTIAEVQEGSQIWTTTVAPATPNYTFTVSNLTGDSETSVKVGDIIMYSYYRYTVLSVSADGTTVFAGNRQGFASTVYQLIVSPVTVIKESMELFFIILNILKPLFYIVCYQIKRLIIQLFM